MPSLRDADEQAKSFALEHEIAETELVFGLVGALGTEMEKVCGDLHLALEEFGYHASEVRLSHLLREVDWDEALDGDAKRDSYIAAHMNAGDRLRREWKRPDALALLAVAKIAAEREALAKAEEPVQTRAWILRQMKT